MSDRLRLKTESKTDLIVDDYRSVREEFLTGLKQVIGEIFSIEQPFVMTTDIRGKCSYCPYRRLCVCGKNKITFTEVVDFFYIFWLKLSNTL